MNSGVTHGRRRGWLALKLWDLVPAVPLVVIALAGTRPAAQGQQDWTTEPNVLAYVLVLVAGAALLFRRVRPRLTLLVCGAALALYLGLGYPFGPIMFTAPAAVYAVSAALPLRKAIKDAAAFFFLGLVAAAIRVPTINSTWWEIMVWSLTWAAVIIGAVAVGAAIRVRRESEADVRAEQARRAVSEEQLRMAQELHDVMGHGLAVIAMQAGVGLHVLDQDPAKAREALIAIRESSREALDGLRAELSALRSAHLTEPARRPTVGLADVDVLLGRIRTGGINVDAQVENVGEVPPQLDLAMYRILQESLTNVLRHAEATEVRVRIAREGNDVLLNVVDNGIGHTSTKEFGMGTGLRGMRQRAQTLGGALVVGPLPGGGFEVRATLPLANTSRTTGASS